MQHSSSLLTAITSPQAENRDRLYMYFKKCDAPGSLLVYKNLSDKALYQAFWLLSTSLLCGPYLDLQIA